MLKEPIRLTRITRSKSASASGHRGADHPFCHSDAGAIHQYPRRTMGLGSRDDRGLGGTCVGDVADNRDTSDFGCDASASLALRSHTATLAPCAASRRAVAAPNPDAHR